MSSLLGLEISKRAIMTHQAALLVTGHNIANANTEGYSRQTANIKTTLPWCTPGYTNGTRAGQLGTGVDLAAIIRIRDQILDSQLQKEYRAKGYWSTAQESLSRIESIFNEPSDTGIRSIMDEFWSAWQDLSVYPEDSSFRSVLIERAQTLAGAFDQTYEQLNDLKMDLNTTLAIKVDEINSLAKQIAALNRQILEITVSGQQPNDLLDKRDLLVDHLSRLVDIKVASNSRSPMIAIQIAGGSLVQGIDYNTIKSRKDAQGMYMPVWSATGVRVVFSGGEVGSILDARGRSGLDPEPSTYKETIPEMVAKLNELAKTIIVRTNELHRGGYSLNNDSPDDAPYPDGIDFFDEPHSDQAINGQWAKYMKVAPAIVGDPMNIAAAQYRTWDGNRDTMVRINFGDGNIALKIAGLRQSDNPAMNVVFRTEVDIHSKEEFHFCFSVGNRLVAIDVDAPFSFDEDFGKLAAGIQKELENKGLAFKVRCEGKELVFLAADPRGNEYIDPNCGIVGLSYQDLQAGSYKIATDTGQPGDHGAQLRILQNYNQGAASNILGSAIIGSITSGSNKNASISLQVQSVNPATGIAKYAYISHEYERDTGEQNQYEGTFEIVYGGEAAQTITVGSLTFQVSNLDLKSSAEVRELVAGDRGILNLTAQTAANIAHDQLQITFSIDGQAGSTHRFVFASHTLDSSGQHYQLLPMYTLDDQSSSNTHGICFDGSIGLKTDSLGASATAAYFTFSNSPMSTPGISSEGIITDSTIDDFWGGLIANVGVMNQEASRLVDNHDVLIAELEKKRMSVSGVSLDEEITNMMRLQHGYNASARMVTVFDEMLDVIINRMGHAGR